MRFARRRRAYGEYPNLSRTDVISDGSLMLCRNPAKKAFGDNDAFLISSDWDDPDELPEAFAQVEAEERSLSTKHAFAWNPDFGYLSPNPTHCGTGLVVQATMHLEGLHIIGDLPPALSALTALRFRYSGYTAEGVTNAAYIFRIWNGSAIGLSEQELLARIQRVFTDLADQETAARKVLVEEHPLLLADAIERALATLRHARLLSPTEYADMLSPIRLATIMGFIEGITRERIDKSLRRHLERPASDPPSSPEEERIRDNRDARFAEKVNAEFANVRLTDRAKELLA